MQAMMFGHSGAFLSGLEFTNASKASAASNPPMLNDLNQSDCGYHS
jgi:hypothetical protein